MCPRFSSCYICNLVYLSLLRIQYGAVPCVDGRMHREVARHFIRASRFSVLVISIQIYPQQMRETITHFTIMMENITIQAGSEW